MPDLNGYNSYGRGYEIVGNGPGGEDDDARQWYVLPR